MSGEPIGGFAVVYATARASEVAAVTEGLREAAIPFTSGLLAGRPPGVLFSVPRDDLERAREIVAAVRSASDWDEAEPEERAPSAPASGSFPWTEVRIVAGVILLHLAIVFWTRGPWPSGRVAFERTLLVEGQTLQQPWRLLSSLFAHADLSHVLWNGASMMVFAVPLLASLGRVRVLLLYLASGIGGGLAALALASPGTRFLGSSGAVAGLFGAWVVQTLLRAQDEPLSRRARFRALGIALLVLPSLLTPTTPAGRSVSVAAHVGGLLTGMVIGAGQSALSHLASRNQSRSIGGGRGDEGA